LSCNANHTNELDTHVAAALARLSDAGIMLLNQAVLLASVNNSVEAQAALCERLVDLRVLPYYYTSSTALPARRHFEVPVAAGGKSSENYARNCRICRATFRQRSSRRDK